jgi:hypothetical protein
VRPLALSTPPRALATIVAAFAALAVVAVVAACGETTEDPRQRIWVDLSNATDQTLVVDLNGDAYEVEQASARILHAWKCDVGQCGRLSGSRRVITVRNLAGICLGGFALASPDCEDREYDLACADGRCDLAGEPQYQQFNPVGCDGVSLTADLEARGAALVATPRNPLEGSLCGVRQRFEDL